MSDEAMLACKLFDDPRKLKYDHKTFERFLVLMHEKATTLKTGKAPWTAEDVQRALFADAIRKQVTAEQWDGGRSLVTETSHSKKSSATTTLREKWLANAEKTM